MSRPEQGNGTLLMVMLLAAVGLLLATGVQRQLDATVRMGSDDRRYWQALNQAESSVNWGLGQHWEVNEHAAGQCRVSATDMLRACLIRIPGEAYWLLRGEGRSATQSALMVLYQRVVPEQASGRVLPLAGGWLDFCPEKEIARCAEP